MSTIRQRHPKREGKMHFPQSVKEKLSVLMTALMIIIAALLLHVDEIFWPGWLNDDRKLVIAGFGVILLILWLASPLLVEVDEHPRPLSGPGKDPRGPWDP